MLEPRRIATRAVAARMAMLLQSSVGGIVGYRTRLDTKVSAATRIEVVTEGILTRLLQEDPALEAFGIVIFDEFHERSLQADTGLALALDAQRELRNELRLLVMSATLDGAALATLMSAPIVTSHGQSYPVGTHYRSARNDQRDAHRDIAREAKAMIVRALAEHAGDVLVFLPGQREIHRTQRLLAEELQDASLRILPLYGSLPASEQDAALRAASAHERKVVLATNIAESSLTIEGTRIVIDSGLERRSVFDPALGMNRLDTVRISRASADQRRGRAGRLESGVCYRLWSEGEHAALAAHAPAEILTSDLAPLALELAAWGVTDPATLRWLDAPPTSAYAQACELLQSLDALDASQRLTSHGRTLLAPGVHPRLAHMLVQSRIVGHESLAVLIAAALIERDVLHSSGVDRDVDMRSRIDALSNPQSARIDRGARQRVMQSAQQLARRLSIDVHHARAVGAFDVGRLLAFAYPDRIGIARGDSGRYVLASGRAARLPAPQAWGEVEFLVAAELDAGDKDAKISLAAPYSRPLLEEDLAAHLTTAASISWDSRAGAVKAVQQVKYHELLVAEQRLEQPDADLMAAAFLQGMRELGIDALPWTDTARALQARLLFARSSESSSNVWPAVLDEDLLRDIAAWFSPWIGGMSRRDHLSRLDLHEILLAPLSWDQRRELDEIAPTHLTVPSGSRIAIDYSTTPPSVAVRLQELFGMTQTPRLARGRLPITLHLLSPARRPVQVTQDLQSFWRTGYPEVKKELKGRYPKHYWPDNPLTAIPTARARPRH